MKPANLPPGTYRNITGNEATALGFVAASQLAKRDLFYGLVPDHARQRHPAPALDATSTSACKTFQAEDEIAAIGAAIGAAFGGAMGMTASSGPGIALKSEAIGLAPRWSSCRSSSSTSSAPARRTGMPTKTEQADLLQVMFGRNGEAPLPIIAPATPAECFDYAIEAWRIALKYMTPVVYLSDAFLATGSEPWRIPELGRPARTSPSSNFDRASADFRPYERDPRRWRARGPSPARPASSTASAASRRPTSPATSATTRRTTTG